MLRTIPPTTNCGCGYFKSKCAEIHYKTSNFSILCIFCGMTSLHYSDFLEHFQNYHFDDFVKSMQCTAEPIGNTIFEYNTFVTKNIRHDPLEFEEKEISDNSDEVLQKLQENQFEVKDLKMETLDEETNIEKKFSDRHESVDEHEHGRDEFTSSDDELLNNKVKVEQCDLLPASNPINVRKRIAKIKPKAINVEQIYDCLIQDSSQNESDNQSDSSKAPTIAEDIDWAQPFEPNLLKNHEKRPYKPRNKPNVCTYCGRTFRRRYQLETHLNIHTGSKPHQCDICGRLFRAVTTLTRHLNTHESREVYNCKFCGKQFTHKAALLSHELRHTQKRNVPCDECEKLFYTINQMDTHKRKVHNKIDDDDLPYACDLCTKRYRSASMLSTHKFKKHYKTAKYSCEQCEKKFITEQQLEKHKSIHISGLKNADVH